MNCLMRKYMGEGYELLAPNWIQGMNDVWVVLSPVTLFAQSATGFLLYIF